LEAREGWKEASIKGARGVEATYEAVGALTAAAAAIVAGGVTGRKAAEGSDGTAAGPAGMADASGTMNMIWSSGTLYSLSWKEMNATPDEVTACSATPCPARSRCCRLVVGL
jgi:hypothetical protein